MQKRVSPFKWSSVQLALTVGLSVATVAPAGAADSKALPTPTRAEDGQKSTGSGRHGGGSKEQGSDTTKPTDPKKTPGGEQPRTGETEKGKTSPKDEKTPGGEKLRTGETEKGKTSPKDEKTAGGEKQ